MKSDLEIRPDPLTALRVAVETARTFAAHAARELRPTLADHGMDAEISFSIKCDGNGTVLLAQDPSVGQLQFKLLIKS